MPIESFSAINGDGTLREITKRKTVQDELLIPGAKPDPLRGVTTTAEVGNALVRVRGIWGGKWWGVGDTSESNTGIYSSTDYGATWSLEHAATGAYTCMRLMLCSDGEILYWTGFSCSKSSGWASNPATATFSNVLTKAGANAAFTPFSVDGDGTKFIAAEYAGVPYWADARYVYISTDSGSSFTQVYDKGAADATSHWHGACYDPWTDRFYVAHGHGTNGGIYFSDNDGTTWARITGTEPGLGNYFVQATPTVMIATEHGIVMGTDGTVNGIHHMRNVNSGAAADMRPELAWQWRTTAGQVTGVQGFGEMGWYDPTNGLVYIGYSLSIGGHQLVMAASDGRSAGLLYEIPGATTLSDSVEQVYAENGRVWAQLALTGGTVISHLTGEHNGNLSPDISVTDSGSALGGEVNPDKVGACHAICPSAKAWGANSLSVGGGVRCSTDVEGVVLLGSQISVTPGQYSLVAGYDITGTIGQLVTALGYNVAASASWTTALGASAQALGTQCVSLGYNTSGYAFDTVIGPGASCSSATSSVAIGYQASTSGAYGCAIGFSANTAGAGADQTVIGTGADTSAADATAIGARSNCAHAGSVALGESTASTATAQLAAGPRHLEITEVTAPGVGGATSVRIYAEDNGAGKTRLMAQFGTGAAQQLAIEP